MSFMVFLYLYPYSGGSKQKHWFQQKHCFHMEIPVLVR